MGRFVGNHKPLAIIVAVAVALLFTTVTGSCSTSPGDAAHGESTPAANRPELRLGYFANITHAPALVGIRSGGLQSALDPVATLEPTLFNSGPAVVEAMFANTIDVAFMGPNPAINAYEKSHGEAVRVIAGSTSGGAALVVRQGINVPADLEGTTLATPQLGSTQDVAARAWLEDQGFVTGTTNGGDVSIVPQPNSRTLDAFRQHQIDGAWVPEPWATQLLQEQGATVLVDEKDLWPDQRWATTLVVARPDFIRDNPEIISAFLTGLVDVVDSINADPDAAQALANDQIEEVTGKQLDPRVLAHAWRNVEFTLDPIRSSVATAAKNAIAVGFIDPIDTTGIFDLGPLDLVLSELGHTPTEAP